MANFGQHMHLYYNASYSGSLYLPHKQRWPKSILVVHSGTMHPTQNELVPFINLQKKLFPPLMAPGNRANQKSEMAAQLMITGTCNNLETALDIMEC